MTTLINFSFLKERQLIDNGEIYDTHSCFFSVGAGGPSTKHPTHPQCRSQLTTTQGCSATGGERPQG